MHGEIDFSGCSDVVHGRGGGRGPLLFTCTIAESSHYAGSCLHVTSIPLAPRMRSEESSDCSWPGLYICKKIETSLSEVHFNTGRLLFEFNGLQYCFAAGQVFVGFANPVSVSFG